METNQIIVLNEDPLAKGCGTTTPTKLGCPCVFFFANMRAARIFITGKHFFVLTRKFIMCKRAFYETSPKIGPNRCARFALLTFLQIFTILAILILMLYSEFHEIP